MITHINNYNALTAIFLDVMGYQKFIRVASLYALLSQHQAVLQGWFSQRGFAKLYSEARFFYQK